MSSIFCMLHPVVRRLRPVCAAGFAVAGVCSVRSERQLVQQLDYNLLLRWFVGWVWTTRCRPRRVLQEPRLATHFGRGPAVFRGGKPSGEALHAR